MSILKNYSLPLLIISGLLLCSGAAHAQKKSSSEPGKQTATTKADISELESTLKQHGFLIQQLNNQKNSQQQTIGNKPSNQNNQLIELRIKLEAILAQQAAMEKRLEDKQAWLNTQQQQIDRWTSFLGIFYTFLGILVAVFGALIPFMMASRASKDTRRALQEIKTIKTEAESELSRIKKKSRDVDEIVDKMRSDQEQSSEQKAAIDEVAKDTNAEPMRRLKALALKAQNNDDWQAAVTHWRELTDLQPDVADTWFSLGYATHELAERESSEERFRKAIHAYKQAIEYDPNMQYANYNLGLGLSNIAELKTDDPKAAESLFREAIEQYRQATTHKPDMHEAFYNWGHTLTKLAELKTDDPKAAESLLREAIEQYRQAAIHKPDKHEAFYNWGIALSKIAELKTDDPKAAESLFREAIEQYRQATTHKPDMHEAFYNWGLALSKIAELKTDDPKAAESLLREAIEQYRQATVHKPDMHEAFYSWGLTLSKLAALKTDDPEAAESLLREAIEQYRQATIHKPDKHEAFYNWGHTLTKIAELNTDDTLLEQAIEQYKTAESLLAGSSAYNLACIYSLRNQTEQAQQWLATSREHGKLPDCQHLRTDTDLDNLRELDWFEQLLAEVCDNGGES